MSDEIWSFDEGGKYPRCICCGCVMGEFEGGKVLMTGRHCSSRLKGIDYICICGDCLANADDDEEDLLKEIKGGAVA